MVLKKLKDVLAEQRKKHEKSNAKRLGFSSLKDYHNFKHDTKMAIRKRVAQQKQKKERQKLEEKIHYQQTTSSTKKVMDIYEKGFKIMDKIGDGMDQLDKTMNELEKQTGLLGGMPNQNPGRKTTSKTKKKSKSKTKKKKPEYYGF